MQNLLQRAAEHKQDIGVIAASLLIALGAYFLPAYFSETTSLGALSLFVLGFLSTATVFLPSVAWVSFYFIALPFPIWQAALLGGAGAAIGELTSFFAGYGLRGMTKDMQPHYENVKRHGWIFILLASIVPNPFFDFIGLAAGYLRMNPFVFLFSCFAGKSIKFALLMAGGESLTHMF
ncbi:MAG: hypothetical protein QW035_01515 [Candidatus Anstonellales archaeon]